MKFRNAPTCHCHIESLDSGSTVEDFAKWEIKHGTGIITVTDHGSLQAARKVYDITNKKYKGQLKPVIGVEAYFRDSDDDILKSFGIEQKDNDFKHYWKYGHLTVHFRDEAAFKVGSRLNSLANFKAEKHGAELKPIWGWKDLEELASQNVTVASGCLIGMVNRHILDGERFDIAEAYFKRLNDLFGDNFYSEVCPHVCNSNWTQEVKIIYTNGNTQVFSPRKKLMLTKTSGETKEGEAKEIAELWHRFKNFKTLNEYIDNRKRVQAEPNEISDIKLIEGNVPNECSPNAPDGDVQARANKFIVSMSEKYKKKIIIGDDSHFAEPEAKVVQDIRLAQLGTWRFPQSHHRITSNEAFDVFQRTLGLGVKTFEGWIDNSFEWASRFGEFKLSNAPSLPKSFYPKDELSYVKSLVKKHGRMPNKKEYWDRLEQEVNLLNKNGTIELLTYFFLAEDIRDFYNKNGWLAGPGRGSSGGTLVNYLFGITDVDPIRHDLSLDRFITPDRIQLGKLPDIDMDFPFREELVDYKDGYLKKRFGDCFAQISTITTLKLRSAVKDVARWVRTKDGQSGHVPEEIEELSKKFVNAPQGITDHQHVFGYKQDDGEFVKGSAEYDTALQKYINTYPEEWESVKKCLGLPRQLGRHASAFVVADIPIYDFIPMTQVSGVPVTQYDAQSVEASGGIKMDLLILNSLKDIQSCVRKVQDKYCDKGLDLEGSRKYNENYPRIKVRSGKIPLFRAVPFNGELYDIWDLPMDPDVFADIYKGRTDTVFQFGTQNVKKWLKEFDFKKPDGSPSLNSIQDLATLTSLDRPGPLDAYVGDGESSHNMLVEYTKRARGDAPTGEVKFLSEAIPETYGILVTQEQLSRVYRQLTGCSGVEAESFRGDIGKKQIEKVNARYDKFIKTASEKIGEKEAKVVWSQLVTFGKYGFCHAHATEYSLIGYACAWLKHHYPLEWWSSVLSHASKNEIEKEFWPHIGHIILPPDINKSSDSFVAEGKYLRSPLSVIQGIGEKAHEELMSYRPCSSLEDLYSKIKKTKSEKKRSTINKSIVEKLVCAGVMDSMFSNDADIADKLYECNKVQAMVDGKKKIESVNPAIVKLTPFQRYQLKKDTLSMYGEDLREIASNYQESGIIKEKNGQYSYSLGDDSGSILIEDLARVKRIVETDILPPQGLNFGVVAYISSSEVFTYQKKKEAAKLLVDVQGMRWEMVKWPKWGEDKLPTKFKSDLTGSVCLVHCKKLSNKDCTIVDIKILEKPLDMKEKKDE